GETQLKIADSPIRPYQERVGPGRIVRRGLANDRAVFHSPKRPIPIPAREVLAVEELLKAVLIVRSRRGGRVNEQRNSPTDRAQAKERFHKIAHAPGGKNSSPYFFPISITRGIACSAALNAPTSSKKPSKPAGVMVT